MNSRVSIAAIVSFSVAVLALPLSAQRLEPDPLQIVHEAVNAEMDAARTDHSHWSYRDNQRVLGIVSFVVETPQGAIKQRIMQDGHPLTPAGRAAAEAETQKFLHSVDEQSKQKHDADNDDRQAAELLNMLPQAFLWEVDSIADGLITLHFRPNPNFHPPDMEARVMGAMSGDMMVDQAQHRIRTFKGHLTQDVTIGWGLLGRLKAGGTFDVERRKIGPGVWEIISTSVNITGHALLFKTISEQQDEVKTNFVEVPDSTTLEQAADLLQTMVNKEASPAEISAHAAR